jgi:hypothetical protein
MRAQLHDRPFCHATKSLNSARVSEIRQRVPLAKRQQFILQITPNQAGSAADEIE